MNKEELETYVLYKRKSLSEFSYNDLQECLIGARLAYEYLNKNSLPLHKAIEQSLEHKQAIIDRLKEVISDRDCETSLEVDTPFPKHDPDCWKCEALADVKELENEKD